MSIIIITMVIIVALLKQLRLVLLVSLLADVNEVDMRIINNGRYTQFSLSLSFSLDLQFYINFIIQQGRICLRLIVVATIDLTIYEICNVGGCLLMEALSLVDNFLFVRPITSSHNINITT
jgi:hypothetical protein